MSAGTVIDVRPRLQNPVAVPVRDGADLQARYDLLTSEVMRLGNWLMSAESDRLTQAEWDGHYARYRRDLEKLRCLGDQLRPTSLRERHEPLTGDALVSEVAELFAA
jgi:hypothetical protein